MAVERSTESVGSDEGCGEVMAEGRGPACRAVEDRQTDAGPLNAVAAAALVAGALPLAAAVWWNVVAPPTAALILVVRLALVRSGVPGAPLPGVPGTARCAP